MHKRRGFTIVELVIVMVIMAILLGLGFVSLTRSQANARDAKRKSDVAAIARGLETRYKEGNPKATESNGATNPGQYPGSNEMLHVLGWDRDPAAWTPSQIIGGYATDEMPGTSTTSFQPPTSGSSFGLSCVWACGPVEDSANIASTVGTDNYIYEPVDGNNNFCCCTGCVRYNLYYKEEVTGNIITVRSSHQ